MKATNQELAALVRGGDAEAQTEAIARLIEALPNQRISLIADGIRREQTDGVARFSPNWNEALKQAEDTEALLCPCEKHTHEP